MPPPLAARALPRRLEPRAGRLPAPGVPVKEKGVGKKTGPAPSLYDWWAQWYSGSHMSVSIVADLGVQPGVSSKMVGCVLFWILNFNFMLILLGVCRCFLMSLFKL
jgi:hypothetical protein